MNKNSCHLPLMVELKCLIENILQVLNLYMINHDFDIFVTI